ncbi:MAG: hypothetical protein LQ352_004763 [Teloschistes flavicans]|nr:MAG: hypothetical protein LQ352_004763 [Teloschistes flavicans]
MTDKSEPNIEDAPDRSTQSILSRTTKGATYLILVQVASRALTFLVNQILLRFLSPELLGISTQLDLYATSVLFFARESLRVALQREDVEGAEQNTKIHRVDPKLKPQDRKAQEVVNLSYLAIALGLPLAFIFASLYIRNANTPVLQTPYIQPSLNIYLLATVLELCSEPCFALAQQRMLYGVRASAETLATFTRCLLTCATVVWASKADLTVGALPFAIGQIGYAAILNVVYLTKLTTSGDDSRQSLLLKSISPSSPSSLLLDRFPSSRLNLAFNIYAQSIFKHVLTTGDSLLVAAFTSLQSQGAYTLATNYGGLVARMVFQPVEESTRTLLGRLLHQSAYLSKVSDNTHAVPSSERRELVDQAATYLRTMLRLYSIISTMIVAVGPSLAPVLLRFVAGSRWSDSEAPSVLSTYCYYIPLLAINGILEAFVSAVATPAELRVQSVWMIAFSAAFAATGFLVLKVSDQGAQGLVLANAVNMTCRIIWSWQFAAGHLRDRGAAIHVGDIVPNFSVLISAVGTTWYLNAMSHKFHESINALVIGAAITGVSVLLM